MKHILKYCVVGILASLLAYVLLSVFIQNALLVWIISGFLAICFLIIIRKTVEKYKFSFIFMVTVFFFVMLAPLVGKKETTSLEKRTLFDFPKFDINYVWGFTYGFSDYLNDRFAYRNASISFLGKLKYLVFRESPMPNLVEIGKDTVLFYTPISYIHEISGAFTREQLDSIRTNLEITTKWFDSKGIKYYFTVPPVKEHIYPELMSERMQFMTKFSRLAQLADYIKDDTLIRFIDYRRELIENKKTRYTYEETDIHWNTFGAFFAYHKIMERMRRDFSVIKIAELSDYKMDSAIWYGGDLQCHLGFDDLFKRHYYRYIPGNGAQPVDLDASGYDGHGLAEIKEMPGSSFNLPGNVGPCPLEIFVVRDSYVDAFKGFLATQFKRSFYYWVKTPPIKMIMQEHPDIVLHEILEKNLDAMTKLPEDIAKDSAFIKQNFPAYYKK
jgi:alginate O-acetyltransferase complex protein AlgJ